MFNEKHDARVEREYLKIGYQHMRGSVFGTVTTSRPS